MSSTAEPKVPLPAGHSKEPIPGYEVIERVGVGGYGEVWKASAPGGLTKALKFVYGHMDDDRAQRELKALNRIKEVRHPFLLSVERIEAVEGQLIIVTELAESTLKDLFDECCKNGLNGIPRDRLLGYMRDAADALDYICEEHTLQHLDIKPENLLLVGGRVKVADFGLVKELVETNASMMGGLTPIYASPEVFDGRPNRNSDQYSLAIVFQELLTGELPFSGRTAAQLAAQHLHSRPRLDRLPPADRPVIARALSKDPAKRFSGCRELIEQLLDVGKAKEALMPRRGGASAPQKTVALGSESGTPGTISLEGATPGATSDLSSTVDLYANRPTADDIETLAPLTLPDETGRLRPTLFLGIGGTAGIVLSNLRRRLHTRFGNVDEIPSLQMLLVDTDHQTLATVSDNNDDTSLRVHETLALPLRRTQEYRENSAEILPWLSRRWLYNIPRSLKTEGLRPLGRLALCDHAPRFTARLREAIEIATDAASAAESSRKTELEFDTEGLRVFVIASLSGGTGSGMVIDVGYAVRQILAELGFRDNDVHGILMHSTDRTAKGRDLAIANTLAALVELNHFTQPAGFYPGDDILGTASFTGRAFRDTYLVHLGDDLNEQELENSTDSISDYLYRRTATAAQGYFEVCRESEDYSDADDPQGGLHTIGLCPLTLAHGDIPTATANLICRTLVNEWRGGLKKEKKRASFASQHALVGEDSMKDFCADAAADQLAAEQVVELRLDDQQLIDEVFSLAEQEMGRDADEFFSNFMKQYMKKNRRRAGDPYDRQSTAALLDAVDAMMGTGADDEYADPSFVSLKDAIAAHLEEMAANRAHRVRAWMHELVDNSRARLTGAQRSGKWINQHLRTLAGHSKQHGERMAITAVATRQEALAEKSVVVVAGRRGSEPDSGQLVLDPRVMQYYRSRLDEIVLYSVAKVTRLIADVHLAKIEDEIRDLMRDLTQLAEQFDQPEQPVHQEEESDTIADLLQRACSTVETTLHRRIPELVAQLEEQVFGKDGSLHHILTGSVDVNRELPEKLQLSARKLAREALRGVKIADIILTSSAETVADGDESPLRQCLEAAVPKWTWCGATKRLVAIMPEDDENKWEAKQAEFEEYLCEPLNVVFDADADLVLCYDVQGLKLGRLAADLLEGRPDLAQVASRLQTRVDVDWTSLQASVS